MPIQTTSSAFSWEKNAWNLEALMGKTKQLNAIITCFKSISQKDYWFLLNLILVLGILFVFRTVWYRRLVTNNTLKTFISLVKARHLARRWYMTKRNQNKKLAKYCQKYLLYKHFNYMYKIHIYTSMHMKHIISAKKARTK